MDVQLCSLFCSLLVIINLYYCIFYQYLDQINLIIINFDLSSTENKYQFLEILLFGMFYEIRMPCCKSVLNCTTDIIE